MCRLLRLGAYAIALVIGGFIGCGLMGDPVVGSGTAKSEERPVGEVTEVVLAGVGDLEVLQADKPGLTVSADDNILPLLESITSGGKLTLRTRSGSFLAPKVPIKFTLSTRTLEKLTVSGSGNAFANGLTAESLELKVSGAGNMTLKALDVRALTLTLSGAGNATFAGTVQTLKAKMSGAGVIHAADLQAKTVEATISGAGNASVWATETLKASVSGAGDIRYKGSPRVDQKVSGAGSIKPLNK